MIEAKELRIDEAGAPCVDGLSFSSNEERVLVLGAPRELMRAAGGLAPPVRGTLLVDGMVPERALGTGKIVAADFAAPLPPAMTALDYVTWSLRLTGASRSAAATLAEAQLASVGIEGPLRKATLKRQPAGFRRAVALAGWLVPPDATLVMWDPLADLAPEEASVFDAVLGRVLAKRKVVVFAGRMSRTCALANLAGEVFVLERARLAMSGSLRDVAARSRTVLVRALGETQAFTRELEARGVSIVSRLPDGSSAREELAIELGRAENVDVFRAAVAAGAIVLEMRPLAAALS